MIGLSALLSPFRSVQWTLDVAPNGIVASGTRDLLTTEKSLEVTHCITLKSVTAKWASHGKPRRPVSSYYLPLIRHGSLDLHPFPIWHIGEGQRNTVQSFVASTFSLPKIFHVCNCFCSRSACHGTAPSFILVYTGVDNIFWNVSCWHFIPLSTVRVSFVYETKVVPGITYQTCH